MILLTDEEIYEIARGLTGEDWEPDVGYRLALTSKKALKAQLKKVFELIDRMYDKPDKDLRLALAYLHKALLEETQ